MFETNHYPYRHPYPHIPPHLHPHHHPYPHHHREARGAAAGKGSCALARPASEAEAPLTFASVGGGAAALAARGGGTAGEALEGVCGPWANALAACMVCVSLTDVVWSILANVSQCWGHGVWSAQSALFGIITRLVFHQMSLRCRRVASPSKVSACRHARNSTRAMPGAAF